MTGGGGKVMKGRMGNSVVVEVSEEQVGNLAFSVVRFLLFPLNIYISQTPSFCWYIIVTRDGVQT